jgi:hypothetical protein
MPIAPRRAARTRRHRRRIACPRRAAAWGGGEWRVAARRSRCAVVAPLCRGIDGAELGATRGVGCVELRDRDSARRVLWTSNRGTPGAWAAARVAGCVSRLDATRMRTPRREPRVSRTGSAVSCRRERVPAREPALDADTVIVNPGTADDASEGSACAPLASTTAAGVGCGAVGAGAAEPLEVDCSTGGACAGCGAGAGAAAGAGGGLAAPRGGSRVKGST